MSASWNRSFQYAGLNRAGFYLRPAREKGTGRRSEGEARGAAERPNEVWRRVTGIFPQREIPAEARRAGLERLAGWIRKRAVRGTGVPPVSSSADEAFMNEPFDTCTEESGPDSGTDGSGVGVAHGDECVARGEQGDGNVIPHPGHASPARPLSQTGEGIRVSLADEWEFVPRDWACVARGDRSVQEICVALGLAPMQLTALLKEYCGLSAQEFLDGLKMKPLKEALVSRLREAAEALWGFPGSYIALKLDGPVRENGGRGAEPEQGRRAAGMRRRGQKRSRYFAARPHDFFYESRAEERARRIAELCDALSAARGCCGGPGGGGVCFDLEAFSAHAGFSSGARLKRACLNVFGKSLRQLEEILASEVLQFYFCAEDRALREIASREAMCISVARARELYHASEDAPQAPFSDEWSKFEELKPEWLSRMHGYFVT